MRRKATVVGIGAAALAGLLCCAGQADRPRPTAETFEPVGTLPVAAQPTPTPAPRPAPDATPRPEPGTDRLAAPLFSPETPAEQELFDFLQQRGLRRIRCEVPAELQVGTYRQRHVADLFETVVASPDGLLEVVHPDRPREPAGTVHWSNAAADTTSPCVYTPPFEVTLIVQVFAPDGSAFEGLKVGEYVAGAQTTDAEGRVVLPVPNGHEVSLIAWLEEPTSDDHGPWDLDGHPWFDTRAWASPDDPRQHLTVTATRPDQREQDVERAILEQRADYLDGHLELDDPELLAAAESLSEQARLVLADILEEDQRRSNAAEAEAGPSR